MNTILNNPGSKSGAGLGLLGYAFLFLPFVLSQLFLDAPVTGYLIAWFGSWFILWMTLTGKVKALPADRPFSRQILRPIIFTQVVFVGYNCLTSIFYFLNLSGYYYLDFQEHRVASIEEVALAAQAQTYYVLAHAALVTGMLVGMNYRRSGEWRLELPCRLPTFFLIVAGATFAIAFVVGALPGTGQIAHRFQLLSLVASVLAFALAIPTRSGGAILMGAGVYLLNLAAAFRSGWKEEVLVMVLLLAIFVFPYYRRLVAVSTPIIVGGLLLILPAFATIVRDLSWSGDLSETEAAVVATQEIIEGRVDLPQTNWTFFTNRFSEIGLFTRYIRTVPETIPYYGTTIPVQAVQMLLPRALWAGKPFTENLVMERVYASGVVDRASSVSAKPQFITDGYLTYGAFGVLLFCLAYGWIASFVSRTAERWFGGYLVGSGLMYNGFFQELWRGNSLEFLLNSVVWAFIMMYVLFLAARWTGLLRRVEEITPTRRVTVGA